jgi:aspartate/glutamate racemase
MKTIGLIGGLSWESTATYYAEINRGVRDALGGLHSASLVLHSFDFADIQALQNPQGWPEAGKRLAEAGLNLQKGGADCLLICSNLMHRVAPVVEAHCSVPLLHIADALGVALQKGGSKKPLLLATKPVMEEHFYAERLQSGFGIEAMVQALQFAAAFDNVAAHLQRPRFEALACGRPLTWKYRGQVVPKNTLIQVEATVTDVSTASDGSVTVVGDGALWVDGLRIYLAKGLAIRIVEG